MPDRAGHDRRSGRPYAFLRHSCVFSLSSLRTRGSSVVVLCSCPGACGRGCAPVPSIPYEGEDCLSAAPVLPVLSGAEGSVAKELSISDRLPTKNRFFTAFRMTTFGFSWGPRPGATGFGFFCRNKRTSSCGGETPHATPRPWMPDEVKDDRKRQYIAGFRPAHGVTNDLQITYNPAIIGTRHTAFFKQGTRTHRRGQP